MIVPAPTSFAAMIALNPTEPVPKSAMESSISTPSELMTAPAPVMIPQPSGASISRGAPLGALTTLRSRITAWVANEDCP